MVEFESPAYVPDYRDPLSCARLATLIRAKPGQEKEMEIYVHSVDAPTGERIKAKATCTPDHKKLNVVVTTANGQQPFTVDFDQVLYGMSKEHPTRYW